MSTPGAAGTSPELTKYSTPPESKQDLRNVMEPPVTWYVDPGPMSSSLWTELARRAPPDAEARGHKAYRKAYPDPLLARIVRVQWLDHPPLLASFGDHPLGVRVPSCHRRAQSCEEVIPLCLAAHQVPIAIVLESGFDLWDLQL
eukprot:CAMPEP_0171256458 /NCGR_PEP_ID=MMETSP0790-20130122/53316_1 /TAXON_ID=2925 /ORGANISM="Alexandrium catenella, Strain OF101" /LENGTH=143 /DNA_ID=CAMNT_0011724489 /DNA_START=240 /DNA_END=672 /DNA_ORIENTATION=+